jgi:arabinofuranosyltransferase
LLSLRLRILLSAFLVTLLTFASRHYHMDDSLIYYRYMRNALDGLGLVYNPGEHVNALTSPFYTYLLLLLSWLLHGNIPLAAEVIFAGTLIAACALTERLFPYAGLLVASMSYFYTTVGMETCLLVFLLILALTLLLSDRLEWLPLVLVLLALTRFEAGAMIPASAFYLFRQKRWPRLYSYIPALAILLAYLIINHHFFGAFVPHSGNAKLGQGRSGYWGRWPRAFLHVGILLQVSKGAPYTMPFLAIAGMYGIRKMSGSNWNVVVLPFAAIMLCFYILFNIPNYHWYYAPFIFLLAQYSVVPLFKSRAGMVLLGCIIVGQAVATVIFLKKPDERFDSYKRVADWVDSNAASSATIEGCEIGEIGWESHHRVMDVIGLTEPKNADHIAHKDLRSWLSEDRPDYIVTHQPAWIFEQVASNSSDYEIVPLSAGNVRLLRRKGNSDRSIGLHSSVKTSISNLSVERP